jgi:hypothetical protein
VAELREKLSLNELRHWSAFYAWEAEQRVPPAKRTIRPRGAKATATALNKLFGVCPT